MPLTLQQAFGANATLANGVLTISLADYPALNTANPSASKALAAILLGIHDRTKTLTEDPTVGVAGDEGFGTNKTFVTRGDPPIAQIQNQVTFNLYRNDTETTLDPDDVI
jgi:hypothetical protein